MPQKGADHRPWKGFPFPSLRLPQQQEDFAGVKMAADFNGSRGRPDIIQQSMDEIRITGEPSAQGDRCKFVVDRPLVPGDSAYFGGLEAASASPLAQELLALPGIESVLIADNTLTVSAPHPVDWPALGLGQVIRKHILTGSPVVSPEYFDELPSEGDLKWAITELLNREINPAVAQHGGYRRIDRREEEQRLHPIGRWLPGLRSGRRDLEAGNRESDTEPGAASRRDSRHDGPRLGTQPVLRSRQVTSRAKSRRPPPGHPSPRIRKSSRRCASSRASSTSCGLVARANTNPR